jgi:hypothetical protein
MHSQNQSVSSWSLMCQSTKSHVAAISRMCSPTFAKMIAKQVKQFCDQPASLDDVGLAKRQRQKSDLTGRIESISHADSMSRMNPAVSQAIFETVYKSLYSPLAETESEVRIAYQRGMELNSIVSQLCHDDNMQRPPVPR